jgi:hypothetical protein
MVLCDAGTLAGQTSTNFSYEVLPVTSDPITNLSSVFAYTPDPNTADNAFDLVSSVNTNAPPVVYLQPTNTVSAAGASAVLQANAFGAAPLAYQWYFEANLLSGETGSSLVLTNLQPEQSGRYSVVVTNVNGATTSTAQIVVAQPATLQVTTGPGSNWSVTLPSVTGLSYTLEYKDSLLDAEWTPILPPMSGTGSPLTLADTNAFVAPARFYRVSAR